jgi:L-threonylcarbamoyladenylate synthase
MRYRHYAPVTPIILTEKIDRTDILDRIERGEKSAYIYYDEVEDLQEYPSVFHFSDLQVLSRSLFSLFRESEKKEYAKLYIERLPLEGIGRGLMNRIEKAAS